MRLFFTGDHKLIGKYYIILGVLCGVAGMWASFMISAELTVPGYYYLSGSEIFYNVLVTSHGFLMVFYAMMPIFISGFGNYLVPLILGCNDLIFPRLNNISLLLLIMSLLVFLFSTSLFKLQVGVGAGWTLYPPLSLSVLDNTLFFIILALHLNGLSSLLNALNMIITIHYLTSFKNTQWTLFVWSIIITSYLIVLVIPVLVVGITTLLMDNLFNTCFYSTAGGGDPILYQHLFWFFGHPEVYILILPAFGLVSEFISEYTSSSLLGFNAMVWSMLLIAFIGCLVWGHHMYTVGLEVDTKCYFTLATSLIGIPTGLKIFLWLSSFFEYSYNINIVTLFSLMFIITFIFGGFTGLLLAQAGVDLLLHDTYFVVGHFHYVLAISLIYVFFAFVYNWFFLWMGLFYNSLCSYVHLGLFFVGSNLLFLPMHLVGVSGMVSSIFDYPSCYTYWNQVSTLGLLVVLLSLVWFSLAWFSPTGYLINNFF